MPTSAIGTIMSSVRVPEIRKKLLFTAAMLALYRLGAYIPAPGINTDAVNNISKALTVHAHAFSKTAREKIEAAGGTCLLIEE